MKNSNSNPFWAYEDSARFEDGLIWFREILGESTISLDDTRLVFSVRADGMCPVSMNSWWIYTPFLDSAIGVILDESAATQAFELFGDDNIQIMEYAKNVGYWVAFPITSFEEIPSFVREGMIRAMKELDARHFKGSLHKRHDKPAYREFVKNLGTPGLA